MENNDAQRLEQIKALSAWKDNEYNGIAEACTGFGKTRLGVDASVRFARQANYYYNVLILTPTEEIRDNSWAAEFKKWKGLDVLSECVNVVCIQTAYKWENEHYDLVIADEFDFMLTKEYIKFFRNNTYDKLLCLTAFIERKLRPLANTISKTIYEISLFDAKKLGIVSNYRIINIGVPLTIAETEKYIRANAVVKKHKHLLSGDFMSIPPFLRNAINTRNEICYNAYNKIGIVKEISDFYPDRNIIIFSLSTDVADSITTAIGDTCVTYHSKLGRKERERAIKLLRDLRTKIKRITAVNALNRGMNIPAMDTGIQTAYYGNKKDEIQRSGRSVRFVLGKIALLINLYCVYFNDDKLENTVEMGTIRDKTDKRERMEWYKNINEYIQHEQS